MNKYFGRKTTWFLAVVALLAAGCASGPKYPKGYKPPKLPPVQTAPVDNSRPTMMASPPAPNRPIQTASARPTPAPVAAPAKPAPKAAATAAQPSRPATRSAATRDTTGSEMAAYRFKQGDPIVVYLRGIPGGDQMIEDTVDEYGEISLPFINDISVGNKTATEAERLIQRTYIDQQIYKYITVNIGSPARSYYMRGEVRQPGRYPLVSDVTIVQAVAAAGGFTEFANAKKVVILRGDDRIRVNVSELEKYPERDKSLESGDVVIISRRFF